VESVAAAARGTEPTRRDGMITGLHHLGLTVRDVEASAFWYEDVLVFRDPGNIQLELFFEPSQMASP
jgi:hypothetical protein